MGLKSRRHFLPNCAHCRMTATALLLELVQLDPHVKIEYFNNVTVSFPDPLKNSISFHEACLSEEHHQAGLEVRHRVH